MGLPAEKDTDQVTRDSLGRFVTGVSGNPKGRREGSKNRTTLMKQFIDESMTRDIAGVVNKLTSKAIELAEEGDKDMLKFLLGEVIKEARKPLEDGVVDKRITEYNITINKYTGEKEVENDDLEGEFTQFEDIKDA